MTKNKLFNVLNKNVKHCLTSFELINIERVDGLLQIQPYIRIEISLKSKFQTSFDNIHLKVVVIFDTSLHQFLVLVEELSKYCTISISDMKEIYLFERQVNEDIKTILSGGDLYD